MGNGSIVDALEKTEEPDPVFVKLVVSPVLDGRYPPNDRSIADSHEVFGVRVPEEGILLAAEQGSYVHAQRGDP